MRIKVILEPSEEGGYTVIVPSLPGCISEGNNKEEALKNIKEAVELYLEPVDDDEIEFYAVSELEYGPVKKYRIQLMIIGSQEEKLELLQIPGL